MPGLMDMHVHLALALPGPTRLLARLETDMELFVRAYKNALDALEAGVTFISERRRPQGRRFRDQARRQLRAATRPPNRQLRAGQQTQPNE